MSGLWQKASPGSVAAAVVALAWLLAGCPDPSTLCGQGLTRCGQDCVDLTSEVANCGACGVACGSSQVCDQGACRCRPGSTLCGGACVVTTSDSVHCGGCAGEGGTTCAAGQVCEQGQCKVGCTLGTSQRCGDSCVNLQADAQNCGTCGNACPGAQSCRGGVCTYDVVAACFNTGQVVGLASSEDLKGPNVPVGSYPQTVDRLGDVLLVLDAATKLRQARLDDYSTLSRENNTGLAPNQLLVRDPYVYVVNSGNNTLQVLRRDTSPETNPAPGVALAERTSLFLGSNTNPWAMAGYGNELFITLYGNLFAEPTSGGRVARVSVANPASPQLLGTIALPTGEALRPFPSRNPVPSPAGIISRKGLLYVALNNLDPSDYGPGGPGLLARINPATEAVDLIELGADCLNPGWLAAVGERLVVSCGGWARYDASYNLVGVDKTGLVLLDAQDRVVDSLPLACPEGDASCALPAAGRFAVVGNRVYLGDTNAGRLFVAEVVDNDLVERRGLGPGALPPLLICPNSGPSLVGDVVALP